MRFKLRRQAGLSFIEIIVGMTLLLTLIVIIGTIAGSFSIARRSKYQEQASLLLSEELDTFRGLNYGALIDIVDSNFQYILYPKGTFLVDTITAQSSPNALHTEAHTNAGDDDITAIAIPPIGPIVTDGTITSYISIDNGSSSPWSAGVMFRALDEYNGYIATIQNSQLRIVKIVDGVEAELFTSPQALTTDTWYKLDVILSGNQISIKLNDILLTPSPLVDGSFDDGYLALIALSNTNASFDTISYTSALTTYSWNFDDANNEVGSEAHGWKRASIYSLPQVATSLTISDEETDSSSPLKNITATLQWYDDKDESLTMETYVAETGITK